MDALFAWFFWTLLVFWIGFVTHWWASRKQRRLLKAYRQQAQALRQWVRPLE
ncbi:MAG TPA: hypothetical protein VFB60_04505 [Ktedonobacteraceae bacterium]|nr:hypothetical protein [Ktedonobacteraceae bacterium]